MHCYGGFEVLTAVLIKCKDFWHVTLVRWVVVPDVPSYTWSTNPNIFLDLHNDTAYHTRRPEH